MTIKLRKPPMKKLPHEKLRDIDPYTGCVMIGGDEVVGLTQKEGDIIADEIEKYYIPRPRFDDGEPVPFGGEYQADNGTIQKLEQLHCFGNGGYVLNRKGKRASVKPGEFVKRPTRVLDADGVETKVGDTVYLINHYDEDLSEYHGALQVMEIRSIGCSADPFFVVANEEGIATDLGHELFTHESPVFDADSVRICKGDTVWHVGDSERGTVIAVVTDPTWYGYPVKVRWDNGNEGFYGSTDLAHREPDSLEKVRDDIAEWRADVAIPGNGWDIKTAEWCDRITALIERGA